jgi:hypothetical protein
LRRLSFTLRPAIVGLSAVALCLAGTGGAVAAAGHRTHRQAAAAPAVTWHRLRLLHGWKTGHTKLFNLATPAYAISGGVVYLDGGVKQPAGSNDEFAVLPRAARPKHDLFITVFSGDGTGTPGTLLILPNGTMRAYSGGARTITMLSAVSFPVATAKWHSLKLINGWKKAIPNLGAAAPSYFVSHGIVYLTGSAAGGSSLAPLAYLPRAARPAHREYLPSYEFGGAEGRVYISQSGAIYSFGTAGQTQSSLDAESFPAVGQALTWHSLKLTSGWHSTQSVYQTGNPAYAVVGPIVYLNGGMQQAPGGALFAFLPKAIAPPHTLDRQVDTYGGTTGSVSLSNIGIASSTPATYAQEFTSLAGIAYPRNS